MKKFFALGLVAVLSACGGGDKTSMIETTRTAYQSVNVNTPGVTGVNCVVQNGQNSYSVIAPGTVMVRRAPDTMNVSCFKGEHMRGQASVIPTFAPREAEAMRGTQAECLTCNYPGTVTVAMALNRGSMEVPLTMFGQ